MTEMIDAETDYAYQGWLDQPSLQQLVDSAWRVATGRD